MKTNVSKKILIAEDEKPLAKALEIKLLKEGLTPIWATNGEEAIEAIDKDEFDFIILDLIMPKKDGYAVLEYLRKINKKIPIAILSNLTQGEDFEKARSLGVFDYFVKSDTPLVKVIEHVKKSLNKK
ncbi:MAG: response regulator [Candidatus Paceibacterota bacterium]